MLLYSIILSHCHLMHYITLIMDVLSSSLYLRHSEQSWPSGLELCNHGFVSDYLLSPICKGLGHLLLDNCIVVSFFDLGQQ